ncbi:MAG TPA: glycosyltransferase family 4 protein [Nocardioidaceae bacterium]|nr:glycosyltransferase family 4 protein [Nocardioidaceae bacterium]
MLPRRGTVGVQTHVAQATDMLERRGSPVRVVHPGSGIPVIGPVLLLPGRALRRAGLEAGVRMDRYWHRHLLEAALRREFARRPPGLVYAQDPRSAHAALAARGSRDTPVVMAVHYNESQAQELVDRGLIEPGGRTDRAIRDLEASVVARLDGVVYVSDFMRRRVEADVPAARNVPSAIVPNFLGPATLEGGPESPRRDCISVGNLFERKNHRFLLHVLAAARTAGRKYTLTLVGDGPAKDSLSRLARELGVAEQVWFAGARFDVDHLLREHRVYVHSAFMENCPFAVIEAFRAGLPVLAPDVGGVPEVVGEGGAGRLWDLREPDSAARVLIDVLDDEAGRAEAGRRARARFEQEYAAEVVGDRLAQFLLGVGPRGSTVPPR